MGDFKQFAASMKRRSEFVSKNATKAVRKVALAVDSQVVQTTPVDTGRARANWIVSINTPTPIINREPFAPGEGGSTAGSNANSAIQQGLGVIANFKENDTSIWIVNSVPYIEQLNRGSSAQAPANFVEQSLIAGISVARRSKLLE